MSPKAAQAPADRASAAPSAPQKPATHRTAVPASVTSASVTSASVTGTSAAGMSAASASAKGTPAAGASAPEAITLQSGAEVLLRALKDQGVEVIFGYPGGAVLPIYDALFKQNAIRHVLVRQEGGAVHAAEGYARSTGKVGVVLVTSGPGATNAVTGLVDALMDSIPVVCLTGQVPTHLIGNDAFQEADTTGITRPATKHNYLVKHADDLARVVHEAFYVARTGRPGPVVIDLPKDIVIGKAPYARAGDDASQLPPADRARPGADRQGGRAAESGEAPDDLCRRRRDQRRPGSVGAADEVRPHAPDSRSPTR